LGNDFATGTYEEQMSVYIFSPALQKKIVECQRIDAISIVNSLLQQFDGGVLHDSIRLTKNGHTLKTVFFKFQFKKSQKYCGNVD